MSFLSIRKNQLHVFHLCRLSLRFPLFCWAILKEEATKTTGWQKEVVCQAAPLFVLLTMFVVLTGRSTILLMGIDHIFVLSSAFFHFWWIENNTTCNWANTIYIYVGIRKAHVLLRFPPPVFGCFVHWITAIIVWIMCSIIIRGCFSCFLCTPVARWSTWEIPPS